MIELGGPSAFLSPLLGGCSIRCSAGARLAPAMWASGAEITHIHEGRGGHSQNIRDGKAILGGFRA
jgi:hypothetical protein